MPPAHWHAAYCPLFACHQLAPGCPPIHNSCLMPLFQYHAPPTSRSGWFCPFVWPFIWLMPVWNFVHARLAFAAACCRKRANHQGMPRQKNTTIRFVMSAHATELTSPSTPACRLLLFTPRFSRHAISSSGAKNEDMPRAKRAKKVFRLNHMSAGLSECRHMVIYRAMGWRLKVICARIKKRTMFNAAAVHQPTDCFRQTHGWRTCRTLF